MKAAGLGHVPLSGHEYQPEDRGTAGVTRLVSGRFAPSPYQDPPRARQLVLLQDANLTGLLQSQTATGMRPPNGNWWQCAPTPPT